MSRRVLVLLMAAVLIAITVVWALLTRESLDGATSNRGSAPTAPLPPDTSALAPAGVRVRVQVLNGSGRNGLARRATQQLRDHGYDVVGYGSAGDTTAVTEVQVTAASRAWGERIVKALTRGRVREREERLGYVDVVVLLGHDWQPSPQSFRP